MKRMPTYTQWVIAATTAAVVTPALAEDDPVPPGVPVTCTYRQPWTPPATAYRSRVASCQDPTPADRVALDDWGCTNGGVAVRVRWWGQVLDQQQLDGRPYYIAFYSDSGDCKPEALLYETCVVPQVQFVGVDCTDRDVFQFRAAIPAFPVTAGEHYWIQISEVDAASANVGQDDFRWSGRQPARFCNAGQLDAAGEFHSPLVDACNGNIDDLSFSVKVVDAP